MLNACPFCGNVELVVVEVDQFKWMVECRLCAATGPLAGSEDMTTFLWNQRRFSAYAPEPKAAAKLPAL